MNRTPDQKRTRSIELAEATQYGAHSARCVETFTTEAGALIAVTVTVPSRSSDQLHTVTYDATSDQAHCDCTAATYGNACCHAGAAILYGRIAADAYRPNACHTTRREQYLATY